MAASLEERCQAIKRKLNIVDKLKETLLECHQVLKGMGSDLRAFAFSHLRQTGSLAAFNVQFDSIAANLDRSEAYLVDAYVGVLRDEIADSVLLFHPCTLTEAQRLARMQEIVISKQHHLDNTRTSTTSCFFLVTSRFGCVADSFYSLLTVEFFFTDVSVRRSSRSWFFKARPVLSLSKEH